MRIKTGSAGTRMFAGTSTGIPILVGICMLCCLAALSVIALMVRGGGYENLLMAFPENIHTPGLDIQKIEQVCEDEFLVTYEIPGTDRIKMNAADYSVTLIGTNSSYPHLMGYVNVAGSFFSKAAWDTQQKHAVLNQTAAAAIFGSYHVAGKTIKLKNGTWLITGVVADGDDVNNIIYVPSSVAGGAPHALAILMAGDSGVNEAYTKSILKTLGVHEAHYRIINTDTLSRIYGERVSVALMILFCMVFVCLCPPGLSKMNRGLAEYLDRLQYKTARDIITENRSDIIKKAVILLLLLAGAVIVLVLLLRILVICLGWRDTPSFSGLIQNEFLPKTTLFTNYHQWDIVLFIIFLLLAISVIIRISLKK
ncbi:hypothetical protein FACS189444_2500 [Spirochaetia bacterium]|nr:hypothetical protein FACS189444_2500 [Spirochaetia bacterium]